jgi:outer membrane protein TolC
MYKAIGTCLSFLLFGLSVQSQTSYSVEDLLLLYGRNGLSIKNNYAQYQIDSLTQINNRNKYRIQSDISFSLPFTKSIDPVTQPDGSSKLLQTNYISPMAQLSLRKKVVFSGGDLAFFSSLNGYTNFINGNGQYGLNWFNLQYSQDIFGFNEYKYEFRKIKLQQEKDRQTLLYSNLEEITEFVELIFQYYIGQQLLEENRKNIEQNRELLKKQRTLLRNGKALAADTLNIYLLLNKLQIKNNELEAKKRFAESKIKHKAVFSGKFEVSVSNTPLILNLDTNVLSDKYLKYTLQKDADLEIFELESEIARSRKNTGIKTAVSLGAGLNSKAENNMRYLVEGRPADKENLALSLTLPISGWNSQKNRKKIASLKKEIYLREQENNKQEAILWAQDIIVKYKQSLFLIELANSNLEASSELERILIKNIENGKSDYIALYQLYTDNQIILLEKYNAIRDIYILKYDLIKKVFFDFEKNISLHHY